VTNAPPSGLPSPSGPLAVAEITPGVSIGNFAGRVLFAGLAPGFIGLFQVNVEVPANARPLPSDPEGSVVRVALTSAARLSNQVLLFLR
jgi:uncharacterized protein (TIGR03437 family)